MRYTTYSHPAHPRNTANCAPCAVLINYGRDHGDAELQGEGEAYAANALRTDLATVHSLHSLFRPKGCFWVVEDPATGTAVGSVSVYGGASRGWIGGGAVHVTGPSLSNFAGCSLDCSESSDFSLTS